MMSLAQVVLALGGDVQGAEAFLAPTGFVVLYGLAWLGLLGALIWLTTRQRGLNRAIDKLQGELQTRLDRDDPPDTAD